MLMRQEVVDLMTNAIENMNRQMAIQQNAPSDQVEQAISQQKPQLMYVNGMLYDLLVENGIIVNR
jgi:hypothetical protein